ncbi:MAG TPA: branched-chain amino acid ABC transporter permease [Desulfobacteraceae bacterium]|nr:branched-chain amino acid ABC transporter permease [Desulfobacteraceae bacterium]
MIDTIQNIIIYTLLWGSIYLLISIGFSLICGVLRIFHLGYGITFVIAAYGMWFFLSDMQMGLIASIALMLLLQMFIAVFVFYKGVFQRYLDEEENLLVISILLFLAASHFSNWLYPVTAGVTIPTTLVPGMLKIGAVNVSYQMIAAAVVGIVVTALFVLMFLKTRIGLIIRAMSQDLNAARLMGASVDNMYYLAMILAVIPPSICVLMIAPFWGIDPHMGEPLLITALLIAILGGLGNLKGNIMASYLIAFIHFSTSFLLAPRFMGFAALFVTLIFLIVKRGGIVAGETIW